MGSKFLSFVVLFLVPLAAWAQTSTDVIEASESEETATQQVQTTIETPAPKSDRNVEKIEVTGSYIRRSDIEGPSPVVIIDRDTIEDSGFNQVGQLLRADTSSPFGGNGSNVNLRGMGYDRTLVLINGQRAPRNGSSYGAQGTDVNMVPLAAVERIEILKDGASATYGSEAIGGVVNIITRKNIDGVAFSTKYDISENSGSDISRTSIAYAKTSGRSSFLTSLQYTHTQGVRLSDYDYRQGTLDREIYAPNVVTKLGTNQAQFKAAPNCPPSQITPSGSCAVDLAPQAGDLPMNSWGGIVSYTYDISGDTQFYTTLIGNYEQDNTFNPGIPFLVPGGTPGFKFTGADAQKISPVLQGKLAPGDYSPGDGVAIYGSLPDTRITQTEEYMGGLIVGTKGYWGNSDWSWDVTLNNQVFEEYSRRKGIGLYQETRDAVLSGKYDPLSTLPQNSSGLTTEAVGRDRFEVNWLNAITTGNLGKFMGGAWSSAVGISAANFNYRENGDDRAVNGQFFGLAGADAGGERQLYSAFSEFSGNFGGKFEAQFAMRFDQYSDFGNTFNPKLAFRYQPIRSLTLRTSAGTGFNAPSLQQAYGPNLEFFLNNLYDQGGCEAAGNDPSNSNCQPISVSGQYSTNPNLTEETSINFNFGAIYEPIKRLSIAVDYWRVRVDDVVFDGDAQKLLELDSEGVDVSKYNATIVRNPTTKRAERITYGLTNAGTREVDGIDTSIGYLMKTRAGDFIFNTTQSYLFNFTESFYEEYGREQVLGQGGQPRWRNVSTVGYKRGWFASQVIGRTTSRVERESRDAGNIEQFTQFDVNFDFSLGKNSIMQVGAINAFDQRPALDFTNSGIINTNLYRPVRVTYMSYRQDF